MMVDNCLGVKDHLVPGSSYSIGKLSILSHSNGKIRIKSTKLHKYFSFVCRPIGMKYRTGTCPVARGDGTGVKLRSTVHKMNLFNRGERRAPISYKPTRYMCVKSVLRHVVGINRTFFQDLRVANVLFYKMFQPSDNTPA